MRHELKYVISLDAAKKFFEAIAPYTKIDKFAKDTGMYEVNSVYYDTKDLRFFYDREESVAYRRKIRLRTYNKDSKTTALFIEIKEKHKQFVNKKRINLKSFDFLNAYENHAAIPLDDVISNLEDSFEAREMEYLHRRLHLQPVVMIRYCRVPMVGIWERDLRITLDTRITAGGTSFPVYDPIQEKFICDPACGVLEIKASQSIPLWLDSVLRNFDFRQRRFSKYCSGVYEILGSQLPFGRSIDYMQSDNF